MTSQIAVRIPATMLAELDDAVGRGRAANRTEAVREAIEAWLRAEKERRAEEEDRRAYAEHPDGGDDLEAFVTTAAKGAW